MKHSVEAVVQSIEGVRVTLSFDDGQKFTLPVDACEGTPTVGSKVRIIAAVLGSEDAGRTALARELLNEILGPHD